MRLRHYRGLEEWREWGVIDLITAGALFLLFTIHCLFSTFHEYDARETLRVEGGREFYGLFNLTLQLLFLFFLFFWGLRVGLVLEIRSFNGRIRSRCPVFYF